MPYIDESSDAVYTKAEGNESAAISIDVDESLQNANIEAKWLKGVVQNYKNGSAFFQNPYRTSGRV